MENAAEDVFNALPPVDAVGLVYEVDTLSYVLSVRDGDMIFTCRVEDISIRRLGAGMLVRYLVEVFTKAIEEHKRGVRNLKLDIPVFPPSPMPGPYMPPGFTPGRIRPTVVKQEDWRLDRLKATPYSGQGIC